MHRLIIEHRPQCDLAPGLSSIIDAAERAGWAVKRDGAIVELLKPANVTDDRVGYTINAKWWCRDLGQGARKAFRVTAPTLLELLGLPAKS